MTEAQRPHVDTVAKFVASLMEGRRFEGLKIEKVEFAYFPSAYSLTISWNGRTMMLKVPSELVDDAISSRDLFQKRKIKKMIKQAFGDQSED